MADHALLSPSAAARWLTCTRSARLEEQFPDASTKYTEEGTIAHELAELEARRATGYITPEDYNARFKEISLSEYYGEEMQACAEEYAKLVADYLEIRKGFSSDAFPEFEVKVDVSKWVPGGFGTADCLIISDHVLEVIDFKYGKGVPVSALNNPQMKIYALGAYAMYSDLYDLEYVEMTICQPRLNSLSTDTISVDELLKWGEEVVKPQALKATNGEGEFVPSDKACKFCKAKNVCKARADQFIKLFDENSEPETLTLEEVAELLKKADSMKAWLADLESEVINNITSGVIVPGWKMVAGRSNRKISDEAEAVRILTANGIHESLLYEKKFLTLTQLEKDFGKKEIDELLSPVIEKPEGKPSLVPDSDKRPPLVFDPFKEESNVSVQ